MGRRDGDQSAAAQVTIHRSRSVGPSPPPSALVGSRVSFERNTLCRRRPIRVRIEWLVGHPPASIELEHHDFGPRVCPAAIELQRSTERIRRKCPLPLEPHLRNPAEWTVSDELNWRNFRNGHAIGELFFYRSGAGFLFTGPNGQAQVHTRRFYFQFRLECQHHDKQYAWRNCRDIVFKD